MDKIIFWLKKLGILRTSVCKAKNADELNTMTATDGGMIQSQQQINAEYAQKQLEKSGATHKK